MRQADEERRHRQRRQLDARIDEVEVPRHAAQPVREAVVVEAAHELVAVVPDQFVAREGKHRAPSVGQKYRRVAQEEDRAHAGEDDEVARTPDPPAPVRQALEDVVVADADGDEVRHVLRRHHRAEASARGEVEGPGAATLAALRDALAAQPEDVGEQEEEDEERVLFGDAVEAYRRGVYRPQRGGDERHLRAEQFGGDEVDQERRERAEERRGEAERGLRADAQRLRVLAGERRRVPGVGGDEARGLQALHQHRVLAVGRGQAVRAVVFDGLELVEFVLAESLGPQAGGAESQPDDEQRREQQEQRRAPQRARVQVAEHLRPQPGGDYCF